MRISNFKVRTRLIVGFALLLVASATIGVLGVSQLGRLNDAIDRLATRDWAATQKAITVRANVRSMSAKTPEYLIADDAKRPAILAKMDEHRDAIAEGFAVLEKIEAGDAEAEAYLQKIRETRAAQVASFERVMSLANDAGTRAQAMKLFQDETSKLFDSTLASVQDLVKFHETNFEQTHQQAQARYLNARGVIYTILAGALLLGVLAAVFLARGIVVPLTQAMSVAEAIRSGKLDNHIETGAADETGRLLDSLDAMQGALRIREDRDADSRGQAAAISRAQAVIEFDLEGRVLTANENFLATLGYSLEEIKGQHHSMFVEPAYRASADYQNFWAKLRRGEFDSAQYKRIGKGGREVWIQATYNPITDASGKPVKVVKYATDITEQKLRVADFEGQMAAIGKAQAVIEFEVDGTVRTANSNFLSALGYSLEDVRGRHHSLFVDAAYAATPEYRDFWKKLARGEYDAGRYKRIGKGGREVWIQASYNPIIDASGRVFKVVKYATDVTDQVRNQLQLQDAVEQTQATVKAAIDGDLTRRISTSGKTGEIEALCGGVNSLLEATAELVKRVKIAAGEVHQGAEEISKGNINLSQRTEEQASSLEETASSMEEMTSTVKQTADNAGQANQLAMAARQQAEKGGAVVGSAVQAMGGINEASKKIADIIGVIDEIAFQTNLLALNAAVEAARAGEQGRGFAVVATEVRNLAGRSATAAKEIKTLIQDSVARVEQGSKLVDESGRTLEEIVNAVKKVTDIVAEIAAASREQSSGIEQVNKAVMQMDTTTQQNAALVEEAAAASQSIVEQAQALSGLVSRYDVGGSVAFAQAPTAPSVEVRAKDRPRVKPATGRVAAKVAAASIQPSLKKVAVNDSSEWSEF